MTGSAALSQWEKDGEHRVGLKVTATRVLSVYEAGMRRKAASQSQEREPRDGQAPGFPSPPARSQKSRPGGRAQPTAAAAGRRGK